MKKRMRTRKQKLYKMKGCSRSKKQRGGYGSRLNPSTGPLTPPQGGNIANSSAKRGGSCGGTCQLPQAGGGGGYHALVGSPWTANSNWGQNNYYPENTYAPNDVSRQMLAAGANPPFSVGGRRRRRTQVNKTNRKRPQKGGALSNFMFEDIVNLGRQVNFGLGSTYNALAGFQAPVNPMPWKGQLVSPHNLINQR
jgi:hypothetical protein